ncbi:MAG: hypothetical protein CMJ85_05975 [Planctomycetes bacterium]|nr:hypothetical protein [Planctomycetota bacterium]MDP6425300.1 ketoacyl-ACP synthase III [Planctomycetota bacterium]
MQQRVWIRGLGVYLPEASLTNEAIEAGMPWLRTSAQWISEHTGIYKRHVARPDQHAADLGYLAAVEALELSQSEPESIDLIMLATNTSQYVYPAGAGRIQNAFGTGAGGQLRMGRAGALDLQQGCSSFIGAIGLASGLIRGQLFRNVLVVGADVATRMVDWTNRDSILLGDAAAACVVSAGEPPQGLDPAPIEVLGHFMRTDPTAADAVFQRGVLNVANNPFDHLKRELDPEGGSFRRQLYGDDFLDSMEDDTHRFFEMDGRQVYRFVKGIVPRQGYLEVLQRSGLLDDLPDCWQSVESVDDIRNRHERAELCNYLASKVDMFVPHSANLSLNQDLAEEMSIPQERMYVTLQKYGNTSAASVGLSLYEALRHEASYTTLTKRDGSGQVKVAGRQVTVPKLDAGQTALLLSFGAGNSWNYVMTRRV